MTVKDKMAELGITLPKVDDPIGNYVHAVRTGNLLFLSGKGPINDDGQFSTGKVGLEVGVEEAYQDARRTGVMLLAVAEKELGSLDQINQVVKVLGMVNAVPEFTEQPNVINGCSDLFVEVLGEKGRHARSAIGVGSLPGNITVEIEVIFEVNPLN
jgi:enamine deaminase RidA (YjgF/YER057c/UK114 family)